MSEIILTKQIGSGSYGDIFLTENNQIFKAMIPNKIDNKYGINPSFLKELSYATIFYNSQNIIKIRKVYTKDIKIGYTMDLYPRDLQKLIGTFDVSNLKKVIFQIVYGLVEAQNVGILNRDIKPPNILVDDNLNLCITDWGLGIFKYHEKFTDDILVQTIWYRCPEHALDIYLNNDSIDMWSVGVIMLELIMKQTGFFRANNKDELLCQYIRKLGYPKNGNINMMLKSKLKHKYYNFYQDDQLCFEKICESNNLDSECANFLSCLLEWDPDVRLTPKKAIMHPYLSSLLTQTMLNSITLFENPYFKFSILLGNQILLEDVMNSNNKYLNKYLKTRNEYFQKYVIAVKNFRLTAYELSLMMSYLDIIFYKNYSELIDNQIEIIVIGIFVIVSELIFGLIPDFNELLEIFKFGYHNIENVQLTIMKIIKMLEFKLIKKTPIMYVQLLSTEIQLVKTFVTYLILIIIADINFIHYSCDEIFGSVLFFTKRQMNMIKSDCLINKFPPNNQITNFLDREVNIDILTMIYSTSIDIIRSHDVPLYKSDLIQISKRF